MDEELDEFVKHIDEDDEMDPPHKNFVFKSCPAKCVPDVLWHVTSFTLDHCRGLERCPEFKGDPPETVEVMNVPALKKLHIPDGVKKLRVVNLKNLMELSLPDHRLMTEMQLVGIPERCKVEWRESQED